MIMLLSPLQRACCLSFPGARKLSGATADASISFMVRQDNIRPKGKLLGDVICRDIYNELA